MTIFFINHLNYIYIYIYIFIYIYIPKISTRMKFLNYFYILIDEVAGGAVEEESATVLTIQE